MRGVGIRAMAAAWVCLALSLGVACGGRDKGSPAASPSPSTVTPAASATATGTPGTVAPGPFTEVPRATPAPPGRGEPSGRIAFVSFRGGQQEIYVVDAEGGDQRNLTNNGAADFDPDFSPDGSRIVFTSNRGGSADTYIMNADGSDVRRLTTGTGGISAKWSPDGSQIAFSRGGRLLLIDEDGRNLTTVYGNDTRVPGVACTGPAILGDWSPDGAWLVFYTADLQNDKSEICVAATDGADVRVVVKDPPGIHTEPNWSPDGTRIAIRSIRDGAHEIYVYDLATRTETKLTDNEALDAEPAWSPDSGWIAFVSDRDSLESDIYVMSADGSDVRRLTTDSAKDSFPTWAP